MEFIEKNVKLNELRTGIPMSTKELGEGGGVDCCPGHELCTSWTLILQ